ncbi:MAG: PaaI family thioesterase [Acidobacteriota bacterium]
MSGEGEGFWRPWSEWSAEARARLERRLEPEPGWEPLNRERSTARRGRVFVPADLVDDRLCLRMFRRIEDGRVFGKVWFGPGAEGPPGHAHGGSQSAVVDHVLGAAVWSQGMRAFTGRLSYTYRTLLPLGTVATCEAWLEEVRGRKIAAKARLFAGDVLFGESDALFIRMREEHLQAMAREVGGHEAASSRGRG